MLIRDWFCLSLRWGLLVTAVGCGGRAGDDGHLVGATPPPMNTSVTTSQGGSTVLATSSATGGSTGVATWRAIGGGSSTGGLTAATGGASLTGLAPSCTVYFGDGPQTTTLTQPELCGNGIVEVSNGERCDDGNVLRGDGCSPTCYVEPHWACPVNCGACYKIPLCGDGILDPGEICDDGNTLDGDGCSATCQWVLPGPCTGRFCNDPSNCGDGQRQAGEDCDLGSHNEDGRYGGCSTQCTFNARCGDGIIQADELCDLGINNQDHVCGGCTTQCQPYPFCGDNTLQAECGEVCDDGVNSGYPGFCSPGCMTPRCGDGVLQPANGEECDVGSGDGSMRPWPHCSMCQNVYMN